ncbi:MAG: hypothetical protein MUE68_02095 [Bacteroidetes bacterium]|jgi:hypothetical protein|nr:hypothetical protein [Bacteroidota bacterium]
MRLSLVLLTFLFLSCSSSKPSAEELAAADFGNPPTNHVELLRAWLKDTYGDYQQAGLRDIQFGTPAKGYHMPSALESGNPSFGYEVEVNFTRPASEGRRTVRQRMLVLVLIRNDQVISYKETTQ